MTYVDALPVVRSFPVRGWKGGGRSGYRAGHWLQGERILAIDMEEDPQRDEDMI